MAEPFAETDAAVTAAVMQLTRCRPVLEEVARGQVVTFPAAPSNAARGLVYAAALALVEAYRAELLGEARHG